MAVPVSLIGTFAGMYLLGFSINSLTLFGMVLSIGIVVDDAIVVLENVERHMRSEHVDPKEATRRAMKEVSRPVIAIVLVLNAVFLPVAFLGGLVGEMYRQFAITIAVSVTISGFVALTLTPAMCALLLRDWRRGAARPARPFRCRVPSLHEPLHSGRRLRAQASRDGCGRDRLDARSHLVLLVLSAERARAG